MDTTYTVCFRGVPVKYLPALEKMIQDDIGAYTDRVGIESATVKRVVKKTEDVPIIEAVVKKRKRNGKPRQR